MERGIRILSTLALLLCVAAAVLGMMPGTEIHHDHGFRLPGSEPPGAEVTSTSVTGFFGLAAVIVTGLFALRMAIRPRADEALVWTIATLAVGGVIALVAWKLSVVGLPRNAIALWPAAAFTWVVRGIGAVLVIQLVFVALGTFGGRSADVGELPGARVVRR